VSLSLPLPKKNNQRTTQGKEREMSKGPSLGEQFKHHFVETLPFPASALTIEKAWGQRVDGNMFFLERFSNQFTWYPQ
jgi:hypothetical protein